MQYGDDGIGCEGEAVKIKEMKNIAFRFLQRSLYTGGEDKKNTLDGDKTSVAHPLLCPYNALNRME